MPIHIFKKKLLNIYKAHITNVPNKKHLINPYTNALITIMNLDQILVMAQFLYECVVVCNQNIESLKVLAIGLSTEYFRCNNHNFSTLRHYKTWEFLYFLDKALKSKEKQTV